MTEEEPKPCSKCWTYHSIDNCPMVDQDLIDEATELMAAVYKRGVNIYMFINKVKKRLKRVDNFPPIVIIEVCKEYTRFKDMDKIKNDYTWFIRVLEQKSSEWHANNQIQEHNKIKQQPVMAQNVKDILKGMFG